MIALSYREALAELTQSEHLDAVYPKLVIALGEVLHPLMQLIVQAQFHHLSLLLKDLPSKSDQIDKGHPLH